MTIDKAYDSWARTYDTAENPTRDLEANAARIILKKYAFQNVIEVGCGTGKNTQWLAERSASLIGLDFSEEMLKRAKEGNSSDNVEFRLADITKTWALAKSSADLISCSLTLEHIEDLDFIFGEASRVLRPQGRFYICELHPFKQYAGSKARYTEGDSTIELDVYTHHVSEYLDDARKNGFQLAELKEWFDNDDIREIPRLISFVFEKSG